MPSLEIGGASIDYRFEAGRADDPGPPLVFLHEGLGSVEQWRTFPEDVRRDCGGRSTLVYSRPGYGRSSPVAPPWPVSYMHREALDVLPAVLAELRLTRPVLIGHSDGASIALIHAGTGHPVAGLVLIAPHVFVEDCSIDGITAARTAHDTTDLGLRLGRYHDDAEGVFRGWNDVWLSAGFRDWNIEAVLPGVVAPVLAIQGDADQYGTLAQLDAIEAAVHGPFERLVMPGGGHVLHTGETDALLAAVSAFCRGLT
jgi:pimeloyl-ACP methyl ester carboxylesterase